MEAICEAWFALLHAFPRNKKDFEAFSSSNKYITQIQTDKIKSEELTNLGEDILGILNYYIKDNNAMVKLVKETETLSPQEYEEANEVVNEILGEE